MNRLTKSPLALPVLIALSACAGPASGGAGSLPAAQPESVVRAGAASIAPASGKRSVYLANTNGNSVDIYPAGVHNPKMSGQLTNGVSAPEDVFIDKNRTVYVLNTAPATVTEYPSGRQAPSVTINLGTKWTPYALTVGPNGTVYVISYRYTDFYCSPLYAVLEFDQGAQSPSRIIHIPGNQPYCFQTGGLAVDWTHDDKFEDLYIDEGSGNAGGGFAAFEYKFKAQKTDGTLYSDGYYALGALQTDARGELIAGDVVDDDIQVFGLGPAGGFRSFNVPGGLGFYLSLDDADGALYLTNGSSGSVAVYDFKTGALRYQFGSGAYRYGLAIDPPSL